ncbi:hypothetical protein [Rhodococcus sp. HNM0569]|uniref:hypothetical protein n=1 Tax=Rhodococcus sp. HNM0569 TaxID=2716340 RepID=UPI00146B8C3A|nr:hypothetical protein [Rhodococcus sp. HNM0569]NLU83624.1 hypothetical protein [Rhodococcus sp. HNM0569]
MRRSTSPRPVDSGPFREWSGWPKAPGVGPALLSLYCWATQAHTTAELVEMWLVHDWRTRRAEARHRAFGWDRPV